MKEIKSILEHVAEIYRKSGCEAEVYLTKARKLKEAFGTGPAIVYCWFYSVPQKWTQVEPNVFELMECTKLFDSDVILLMQPKVIASVLRPMIFHNEISLQLKNFCSATKSEYSSWDSLGKALREESIFEIFSRLRKNRNIRVTFKNLAAMKAFVGMNNDLIILDTHVAKVMGIGRSELRRFRFHESYFKNLLDKANKVTTVLKKEFSDISTIRWSLAIWFEKAEISARELLNLFP